MSRSSIPRDQSPDESGYLTHIPRADAVGDDEYDPSESENAGTSPERSVTPSPVPSPRSPNRGRVRMTARMSVRSPIREVFTIPSRDEAGPSRPRGRRVSPPPVTDIPRPPPTGMTSLESRWVLGLARDLERVQLVVSYHKGAIDALQETMSSANGILSGLVSIIGENDQLLGRLVGDLADSRRRIERLKYCLMAMVTFLVVLVAWLAMGMPRRY
jgi:hypothetical protein